MKLTNEMLQNLRQDYRSAELVEQDAKKNALEQFGFWFQQAIDAQLYEPNVMTLATADKSGRPSARIVLLKGFDEKGFTFYTNYLSRKGKELKKNPFAAVVFFWPELERQVRIEGTIEKLDKETSEAYFLTRPLESQIGAVVSPQSQPIPNREFLENKFNNFEQENAGKNVVKPAHWGGYILKPNYLEFWQGRTGRLHDRLSYVRKGTDWIVERLAP